MQFYEDIEIGTRLELGSYQFQLDEIKIFAAKFDPQPFHLDEEAAAKGLYGRICASGWHTASIGMKLLVAARKKQREDMQSQGIPVAKTGPSPGFENLKWLKPVYPGDTMTAAMEVTGKRVLATRPEWGMVFNHYAAHNQNGDLVYCYDAKSLVERRVPAGQSA